MNPNPSLHSSTLFRAPSEIHLPQTLESAARTMLTAVGEDLHREGLQRTPLRFAKALRELCSGYDKTVADVVGQGVFAGEGEGLVAVRDIEFHSLCEHHMLPFWGKVSVAYYPADKILGLSKIPRIVDVYAHRLQVQERLTKEVAVGIAGIVSPRAVAVRVEADHMCMRMRGVKKTHSSTTTEFMYGGKDLTATERERMWESISK